jgi:hypothetical protein
MISSRYLLNCKSKNGKKNKKRRKTMSEENTSNVQEVTSGEVVPVTSEENDQNQTTKKYETLAEELTRYRVVLDNAQNDTSLHPPLASYGYDLPRLQVGDGLWKTAEEWFHKQQQTYEKQYEATVNLEKLFDEANQELQRLLGVARVAFKGDVNIQAQLHLNGRRSEVFGIWVHETEHFFINSLNTPAILEGFVNFNVSAEDLQRGQEKVEAVKAANSHQEKMKGEAQRSTEMRDTALEELRAWMYDFFKIARIAFADDRQQLEKFKILARS